MFPDVEAEERGTEVGIRDDAFHERVVLVGGAGDLEFTILDDEPGPAGAEAFGGGFTEGFFEVIEGAERGIDGVGEVGGGLAAFCCRGEGFPEEVVVPVAAAVITDGVAGGFVGDGGELGDEIFDRLALEGGIGGDGGVEVIDVGLVMFAMVNFHGFGVDVGLECVEGVRERGEGKGPGGWWGLSEEVGGGESGAGGGSPFDEVTTVQRVIAHGDGKPSPE